MPSRPRASYFADAVKGSHEHSRCPCALNDAARAVLVRSVLQCSAAGARPARVARWQEVTMRVQDVMTTAVQTISPSMPAEEAGNLMRAKGIHHLVVCDGPRVVGLLSDRDIGGRHGAPIRENPYRERSHDRACGDGLADQDRSSGSESDARTLDRLPGCRQQGSDDRNRHGRGPARAHRTRRRADGGHDTATSIAASRAAPQTASRRRRVVGAGQPVGALVAPVLGCSFFVLGPSGGPRSSVRRTTSATFPEQAPLVADRQACTRHQRTDQGLKDGPRTKARTKHQDPRTKDVGFQQEGTLPFQNLSPLSCSIA